VKPAPSIRGLLWQCTLLLRLARLLVPKAQRKAWYQEWYGEIWHWAHFLAESGRLNTTSKLDFARHCWGAFPDAAWHRFNRKKVHQSVRDIPRSAGFCLGSILALLLLTVLSTGLAPTIRRGFTPLPYYQPDRIAVLSFPDHDAYYPDSGLFQAVRRWSRESRTASAMAAYSLRVSTVAAGADKFEERSARVSPNLFEMLGVKASLGRLFVPGDPRACPDCLVISDDLWKERFGSDPGIIGRKITFSGAESTVIGVLPSTFTFLTPEASVWALPPSADDIADVGDHVGAVLRLRPGVSSVQAAEELRVRAFEDRSALDYATPEVAMIVSRARQAAKIYVFFALLALVGGLALASSRLAATRAQKIRLDVRGRARVWAFLILKILLLLSTCFVFSLELPSRISIMVTGSIRPSVGPISAWLFLVAAMAALFWSLHDQTRRCRVCLKRLGNEVSVGAPSHLLLDWSGTELVCSDGHGLLHVPEMNSSWLDDERWVHLDESWKPLFEGEKAVGQARSL
jgi:hypothetical protein